MASNLLDNNSDSQNKLPQWNLADLFSSEKDAKIARSENLLNKRVRKFAKSTRGKIPAFIKQPKKLLKSIIEYELILKESSKIPIYAGLLHAETSLDPARGAFLQKAQEKMLAISSELTFFELELQALGSSRLKTLANHKILEPYRHYLLRLGDLAKHRLTEPEEKIIADRNLTGNSALVRLYSEELSFMRFRILRQGEEKELSQSELLALLQEPDRAIRQEAAAQFSQGMAGKERLFAFIYNMILHDKAVEDRYRKFSKPEDSRHLENEISSKVVQGMVETVERANSLVGRYYKKKRALLKLDKLYDYDRYAPIGGDTLRMSFEEGRSMILAAFQEFDPSIASIAASFFESRWIDAAQRPGKRGGAFCSYVSPDLHPYILMNFNNKFDDVLTLAHELGHGIHACLMRKQSYLNFGTPLTLAETASVFSEMIVFDYARRTLPKEGLLTLLARKIESIFATVFRQISLYQFEQAFHSERRAKGELPPPKIRELWRVSQEKMFAGSIELTPGYEYWWSAIPHFAHTPFYVYAYAFGELLTLALYRVYQQDRIKFVPRYLDFLSSGSSKTPPELLRKLGVSLGSTKIWSDGIAVIENLISEFELVSKSADKISKP